MGLLNVLDVIPGGSLYFIIKEANLLIKLSNALPKFIFMNITQVLININTSVGRSTNPMSFVFRLRFTLLFWISSSFTARLVNVLMILSSLVECFHNTSPPPPVVDLTVLL